MNLFNVLAEQITIYDQGLTNVPLTGLVELVKTIIEKLSFGGTIAVGILLCSLILKIIPLPFDIYSRVSTKKNAMRMERMRPELEKLQKQYANNKELYQQKMMALYKKEGYSTFATCLPTLFTLVFFIVVITAFNQYSTYAKIEVFNDMAIAYSQNVKENQNIEYRYYDVYTEDIGDHKKGEIIIDGNYEVITDLSAVSEDNQYRIKYFTKTDLTQDELQTLIYTPAQDAAARVYIEKTKKFSFLWVENIWIEDLPWKKAFIDADTYVNSAFVYSSGCSSKRLESPIKSKDAYEKIMGSTIPEFQELKNKPNGYLILVVLSIGTMLLSQLVMNKTQKTQMELQSVDGADGQAAQTSKMMMWMMPIMFGFFSFMYTASFSLYLIVSTVFSMFSTIIINKIVEKMVEKQIAKEEEAKYQKRYGHLLKNKEEKENK
ncbi:MAG: membrane protein insertase YidC [Clostridia bacterium]|nr:membrane protein insertase YidC [Clostridia bacterium]